MSNYNVIICGSGPAGTTAGILLSRHGLGVLVLDRKCFPRFKLCGGLLTWKTQQFLDRILGVDLKGAKTSGILEGSFFKWGLGVDERPLLTGEMEHPFLLVDRKAYDSLLVRMLQRSGAVLRCPETVTDIEPETGMVKLLSGERLQGDFIIGADGAMSVARRKLASRGVTRPPFSRQAALALETHVPCDAGDFPDFPCIHIGRVPSGYLWAFPGQKRQCLGIGSSDVRSAQELKGIFLQYCRSFGVDVSSCRIRGHPLPYGDFEVRPGCGRVLLCGDAAGLADPLLGEGIFYAHYSGLLAARAILESGKKPRAATKQYSGEMQEIVRELRCARLWRKLTLHLLSPFDYALFRMLVSRYHPELAQTVHGMRSFRWLRPRQWSKMPEGKV
ncbi:MAG: geranylgeranyl reductase family protein [Desulfonatronovibrionaceae bacterium]